MPGENIYDWSTTAASNDAADTLINWREGMARAAVNDSARSLMAAHAKQRDLLIGAKTTGGTSTAYTFTSGVGYTVVPTNFRVLLKINQANTGSATLSMDGITGATIKTPFGADLVAGDLKANFFAEFLFNGTNWILLSTFLPPASLTNGTIPTVPAGGDPNTITITTGLNLSALFSGLRLTVKVSDTNTGPATLNVDGLGPVPIVDQLGNPLIGGEMVAGSYADLLFDGTKFVLLSPTLNPAFYAKRTATQTLPLNTFAKIQLNLEDFDIGGYFNTTTNRYTPLVAGRYLFIGYLVVSGMAPGAGAGGVTLVKNGANTNTSLAGVITGGGYFSVDVILDMNGTTDYVELWGFATDGPGVVGGANMQGIRLS